MKTINCGLKLNEYHTGIATGLTPAEVLVLTAIHSPGVDKGQYPAIINAVYSEDALTVESPAVAAEDEQYLVGGRVIKAKDAIPAKTHPRTDAEELDRLTRKYTQTLDGDPKKHIVTQLFPGINAKLPHTFSEIGLKVADKPDAPEVKHLGQSTIGTGEIEEGHPLRGKKSKFETAG